MTVYELMQELSRYKANTEVRFSVKEDFEAESDRETVYFDDIEDNENESVRYGNSYIQINLEY